MLRVISIDNLLKSLEKELGSDDEYVKVYKRSFEEKDLELKEKLLNESLRIYESYDEDKKQIINSITLEWIFGNLDESENKIVSENENSNWLTNVKPANDLPC